jgi:hypothetical protein
MRRKDRFSFHTKGSIKGRYFLVLLSIFISSGVFCQLKLDFETPFPGLQKWEGHVSNFKVNAEGQLQLNALAAGESSIFTKFKVPADSIQIDLYFKLQFAPSADNMGKIYLFIDKTTEIGANGYYLKLGENGSNDAIQLWKLTNGNSVLLGSGNLGAISGDPADARVQIKIYRNGLWVMKTDYDGKTNFEDDLEVRDNAFLLPDSMYFGINCKYTSSRTDKFFYDDIGFKTVEKDITAPDIVSADVIDANTVIVVFSEPLDEASATKIQNYTINNGLNNPDAVIFNRLTPNRVVLKYNNKTIQSGISYTLSVNGVKDRSNNQKNLTFPFVYKVNAEKGDLIITEVLTDPYTGGEDFVEIYNRSAKFVKLDSMVIANFQKNETKVIRTDMVLYPGKYVAISRNTDFLKSTYQPPDTANFLTATLPSFNVDGANISLLAYNGSRTVLVDSFEYNEKMHFELIDETKGVSLERISLSAGTNDISNWHSSSSQTRFATPGYKNSSFIDLTSTSEFGFWPDKKVFTPNGDGHDDFVLLKYNLEKPGYLATVKLFDTEGFEVLDLANNFLLGTDGFLKWEGTDSEGRLVRMGMYIVMAKLFHPDGETKNFKYVVVAADNF